jgi:hypothetical protein
MRPSFAVPATLPLALSLLLVACGGPSGSARAPAPPAWELQGTPFSWKAYALRIPPTLKVTKDGTGGFVQLDGQGCTLFLLPPVAAQADQDQQAYDVLKSLFSDADPSRWGAPVGEGNADPLLDTEHHRGVSAEGWPYVDLRMHFRAPAGASGFTADMARILLADQGDGTSAAMVGYQTDSAVRCINEGLNPYEWILTMYSLSLPGAKPANRAALHDAILGEWFEGDVGQYLSTGLLYVFANNGHMAATTTVQTYQGLNASQYLETTSSWTGDGFWQLSGGVLQQLPADPALSPSSNYIRAYRERNTTEPSGWREYLWMLGSCGSTPCESDAWRP